MSKTQIYKVIKILNEYEIVINAGANKGLSDGDRLQIFVPGVHVVDPDTKEDLGTLDNVKATIVVKTLLPKMAICVNAATESPLTSSAQALISTAFAPTSKKLNVNTLDISGGSPLQDSCIKLGDLVRKMPNPTNL